MVKEYRILPVQVPVHGLKEDGFLSEPAGYELFKRAKDGIRLQSIGIYDSEDEAKKIAVRHAAPDEVRFV